MYPTSSQKRVWIFESDEQIANHRRMANKQFIDRFRGEMTDEECASFFLTPEEETILLKGSELILRDFCRKFSPPMIKSVIGTSFHYFKRFYVNNSVMDYHPKEILVTCVYLACKVEEFNVSIQQFVANIKGDREKAAEIILNNELLLMHKLNYFLTVHNPLRPIEGFLIDIKTRHPQLHDPDRLRPGIEDFIDKVYLTNVCLLYSPSQIGLAAILYATSAMQENLDQYVTDTLFGQDRNKLPGIIDVVRDIRFKVKLIDMPQRDTTRQLEDKLSHCRNQANNPDSEIYKKKLLDMLNDDDERVEYKEAEKMARETERKLLDISDG